MSVLSIDFETASECDLIKRGAYNYAADPSTRVYMMGYAFDNAPVEVWTPDQPFPSDVTDHIASGGALAAFNAQFERLIFWYVLCNDYDVPVPELEQFHCTAVRARTSGLPGKLSLCARALGLPEQKQVDGMRLIKTYSVENVPWDSVPAEDWGLFIEYCRQDVIVERAIAACLRPLTDREHKEYVINELICDRGVPIDTTAVTAAVDYADEIVEGADAQIELLTGRRVKTARARKTRDEWLKDKMSPQHVSIITTDEGKISFDEQHRSALLAADIPDEVRAFTDLVNTAGGSTLAKYTGMLNRQIDNRVQGALLFNGAGQTGRFSSTGIQLHNMRRDTLDDPDSVIDDLLDGFELDRPADTLASLIRSMIYLPDGLSWYDWSAIEGRVAPWLSASARGERKLDLYREGVDPYVYNASQTFGVAMDDVTKGQRQAGKIQELALQFLGGAGALASMSAQYGLIFDESELIKMRDGWRMANPWAADFGRELDAAVVSAVAKPGAWFEAGRVAYHFDGVDWLWCRLPSGRLIAYYQPRVEWEVNRFGSEQLTATCLWGAGKPKRAEDWPRRSLHGGLLLENVTQATAADLLRDAVLRCHDAGLKIVLHVHDEIVIEGRDVETLGAIMLDSATWAEGLPLEGDGGSGQRYGK